MKITEADRWFGKCVKERAGWKCEACGRQYQEGDQGLHTSHFWSRRYQSIRHDPDNAAAHCFGCHQRLGGNPLEFREWIVSHLPPRDLDALTDRRNTPFRIKPYLGEIARHFRGEFTRMQKLRASGEMGRIEFERWDHEG